MSGNKEEVQIVEPDPAHDVEEVATRPGRQKDGICEHAKYSCVFPNAVLPVLQNMY